MASRSAPDVASHMTAPGYAVAALFILLPIVDTLAQVWPFLPGNPNWRYGTVGLGANYLISFLFGMVLLGVVAAYGLHRRTLRVLAPVAMVIALALLLAAAGFALDALEVRRGVPRENASNLWVFDVGAAKAFFKYILGVLVMAFLAFASRRAWRACPAPETEDRPTLVGRRATPAS